MGPLRRAGSEASRLCWLCGSAGMSETCFVLVGSASAGGGPANRRVCTRGRTRRSASYRALQSIGHGIHEAVPRLQGRWGALDVLSTAAASADGIGGGISKRLPNARSTGRSMRTRCPNSGSVLLFSDPARLARIRVGVRDTSTFIVQVDVNIAGRWNMAEIALLPRRLAEWSGTPPRWYPLQLGGC